MMRQLPSAIYPSLAALALLAVAVSGVFVPFAFEQSPEDAITEERILGPVQNRAEPDPVALSRGSPFSPGREPYARPVIIPEPAPPPPRRDVVIELIGIIVENGERSAVVLLDGVERTLRVGSETEAGEVVFIGLDSVRFHGEVSRTVSLFD